MVFRKTFQWFSEQLQKYFPSIVYPHKQTTSGVVQDDLTDIPIRVVNPKQKRDVKTYILRNINPQMIQTLKDLREEILEQLGKGVVNFALTFDVGYMSGGHRICFKEKDIKSLLPGIVKDGGSLWFILVSDGI